MQVKEIRRLAGTYSLEQLQQATEAFEKRGENTLEAAGDNEGEVLTHLLAASFVQTQMQERGIGLNNALREYSRRVRSLTNGGPDQ